MIMGGYVNHPKDPGGETNLGVTKRVYESWVMENDLHKRYERIGV